MTGVTAVAPVLPPGLFLGYQQTFLQEMLSGTTAVLDVEKSRRTGFSWTASWGADLTAAAARSAGGSDVFYIGYNLEMAREFIDYCAEHAKILQLAADDMRETFFTDPEKPESSIKVFRIDFASGFKILALPSVPRALRGMQGLVIIDEAAFHDNLDELLKAAMALLMWGGRVVIISTHDGDNNPFNVLIQDIRAGRKPYALQRVTLDDALQDGLFKRICETTGKEWSPEAQAAWRADLIANYGDAADEELFCIPRSGSGAYLPGPLIDARTDKAIPVLRWECTDAFSTWSVEQRAAEALRWCETVLLPQLDRLDPRTPHAFGEDFGRSGDLTVLWPFAIERSLVRRTPFLVELRNVPFDQQRQVLFFMLDRLPRLRGGAMDGRGNGQYLAEVTVQRYGARVQAVMLSEGWYRENMPKFKAAFEDGQITVPADRDVHDDLRALRLVRGVARIPEIRSTDAKGQKRHGDAAIAGALGYFASLAPPEEYAYQSAAPDRSSAAPGAPDARGWAIENELAAEASRREFGVGHLRQERRL